MNQAVEEIASLLQIDDLLERMPQGLSGGEKQKVALARALVLKPAVLLLDEPVSSVDEEARDCVCRDLRRIQRELSITTLHVSHNRRETELVADRVERLHSGRLGVMIKNDGGDSRDV